MLSPRRHTIAIAVLVLAGLVAPLVTKNFVVFQLTLAMIHAIAILGLNLLTGFSGQFSLGHSAFFAMGAYATAILIDKLGVAYYWTPVLSGIGCFGFGFLFGLPALRLEGGYLALATFALAIATPQILKFSPLEPLTGGVQGISLAKPEPPAWLPVNADLWLYYLTMAVTVALFACAANLVASRSGRALLAIRDHPIAAKSMGVNLALYKSVTFGVSALYTGIAGSLAAIVVQFVAPDSYTFLYSIALLVGLVVGGVGSIPGAFLGGLFILFIPNVAERVSKSLAGAIYAVSLLLVIFFLPRGIAGGARTLARRLWPADS